MSLIGTEFDMVYFSSLHAQPTFRESVLHMCEYLVYDMHSVV